MPAPNLHAKNGITRPKTSRSCFPLPLPQVRRSDEDESGGHTNPTDVQELFAAYTTLTGVMIAIGVNGGAVQLALCPMGWEVHVY